MMENTAEKCFICTEETSHPLRNLMQLSTKYSGTLIYKIIERFLEGDLSENVANLIVSVICQECVVKLNDYDAAHTKAIIIQKEFTDLLRKNFTIVGNKIEPEEQMCFKVETDGSYLDALADLDQITREDFEEESPPLNVQPATEGLDTSVSMKCNACGIGFGSLYDMQHHSHTPAKAEYCIEFLDDVVEDNSDEVEYIDEERLDDVDKEKADGDSDGQERVISDNEIHFEELDFLSDVEEGEDTKETKLPETGKTCPHCKLEFSSERKLKVS